MIHYIIYITVTILAQAVKDLFSFRQHKSDGDKIPSLYVSYGRCFYDS